MKWLEMEYFLEKLNFTNDIKILDVGCGNWRFLWELLNTFWEKINTTHYTWADLSSGLLEEAKKDYSDFDFHELNMLDLDSLKWEYSDIFFYASFHHLQSIEDRRVVLKKTFDLLQKWWKVYMTNWALNSDLNKKRYSEAQIPDSQNIYWSIDFNIKLAWNDRYYHCFSLEELKILSQDIWFRVIENRLFENDRNFITILEK
jgi:ubiquinone/menaquinone biosynthesis C-methylase UbiE